MSNISLSPLNYPTCDTLENQWNHQDKNISLKREWNDCVTNNTKNPQWKKLSTKQQQSKVNQMCCEEVLQCSEPNKWLHKNNFDVTCNITSQPIQPHFGDVHKEKMKQTMNFGVY